MTTRDQLPVEAKDEPQVASPAEEVERARKAAAQSEVLEHEGHPLTLADPDNPLRMPGEMSARPDTGSSKKEARRTRPAAKTP